MKKLFKTCILLLCFISLHPALAATNGNIWLENTRPGYVTVKGKNIHGHADKHQVNIYVDNQYTNQTFLQNGHFSIEVAIANSNKNLEVKILEFFGKGKANHYQHKFDLTHLFNSHPDIKGEELRNGRMTIIGSHLQTHLTYQVNFYVNQKFVAQTVAKGGQFRFTLDNLQNGDVVDVSVLNYYGNGQHKHVYLQAKQPHAKAALKLNYSPYISTSSLNTNGNLEVRGHGFDRTYDINIYVNDHFQSTVRINKSFSEMLKGVKTGDKVTVKVLNYYGNGQHLERHFYASTYSGSRWLLVGAAAAAAAILASNILM